jgi:L-lysine 2,3-aminomutase
VGEVLPFRVNDHVLDLIDWRRVPDDPIFQLTFPQREMLEDREYRTLRDLLYGGAERDRVEALVRSIRLGLNPHPSGQMSYNRPIHRGKRLDGLQHKYRETVLFFPGAGQTCHAYCTYCFRWAQFVEIDGGKFSDRDTADLVAYLESRSEVTDVVLTGGDPMIMKTRVLRRYVEPLLDDRLTHVQNLRIGTKALSYWPARFVSDTDADDLLRLFERVVSAGRHLSLMVHFSHPVELGPELVERAVCRIRSTGAELRIQAPVVRYVNDDPEVWAELWSRGVAMGMVPYYLFVERDTGPRRYFQVPLVEAHDIFRRAYSRVSGLARTVRGPVMSVTPGKVRVLGVRGEGADGVMVLDYLQARDAERVRRPFLARYSSDAVWWDDLEPADPFDRPFFEGAHEPFVALPAGDRLCS